MPEQLDFFRCLETALEPVFSLADYARIRPDLRAALEANKLFKDGYITEVECDRCGDDCPGNNALAIKYDQTTEKRFYTCPTGYLKNPVWLSADAAGGRQFDFNKLAELICAKSNLQPGGNDINNFRPIAHDQIAGETIALVYCRGLSREHNLIEFITEGFSHFHADKLFIITPCLDVLNTSGINNLKDTRLVTLKTILENDFNIIGIIKQKSHPLNPDYQFFRQGNAWLVSFSSKTVPVNNSAGMLYIRCLLGQPRKKLTSLELQHAVFPPPPKNSINGIPGKEDEEYFTGIKISADDRKELEDLQEQYSEADKLEDTEKANGLHGRMLVIAHRYQSKKDAQKEVPFIQDLKKYQKSISANLDRTIDDINESHPELAAHLKAFINRSRGFVYQPDKDIDWVTGP